MHIGQCRLFLHLKMEDHVWTRIFDEVDKISNTEQLELVNFDGGDLVSQCTIDEVSLFRGVIYIRTWILHMIFI